MQIEEDNLVEEPPVHNRSVVRISYKDDYSVDQIS
jgi:hypothetical protein